MATQGQVVQPWIPTLRRQRQAKQICEFKTSQNYTMKPCFQNKTKIQTNGYPNNQLKNCIGSLGDGSVMKSELQRTQLWFPASTSGGLQLPGTTPGVGHFWPVSTCNHTHAPRKHPHQAQLKHALPSAWMEACLGMHITGTRQICSLSPLMCTQSDPQGRSPNHWAGFLINVKEMNWDRRKFREWTLLGTVVKSEWTLDVTAVILELW